MASFGSRLRSLRQNKNLRQEDLAKILKVARATVGRYENDERFPDKETLHSIADYFDVSLDYLLLRTDIKAPLKKQGPQSESGNSLNPQGLSKEDIKKVEEYIALLKQKYRSDGSEK